MSSSPLISIVTPSYNQATFIRDTLDSVADQTYGRTEHVVVDGNSDDGTTDALAEYDVSWISETDDGQADAFNKGVRMANGNVIGWLNSDDVFFDMGVLERVARYFEIRDADVIYGDMALINADSTVRKIHCAPDFDYERLLRYCFIVQPSVFIRGEILGESPLDTDLPYALDYDLWLRLGREHRFVHVDDVLSGDRNHQERKIIEDRERMRRESETVAAQYGDSEDRPLRTVHRAAVSGIPRRFRAMKRTIELHRNPPRLAFDGQFESLPSMLWNVWRSNKHLL